MVSGRDKDCEELRAKRGPQGRPDPTPDLAGASVGMSGPAGAAPAFSPQCIPGQPFEMGTVSPFCPEFSAFLLSPTTSLRQRDPC